MSKSTPTPTACSDCAGEHLWNWLYRHRVDCPLLASEDATRVADADRLGTADHFTRPATRAELDLAELYGWSPDVSTFRHWTDPIPPADPVPTTTVRRSGGPVPHRTVDGIDPDDRSTWRSTDDD